MSKIKDALKKATEVKTNVFLYSAVCAAMVAVGYHIAKSEDKEVDDEK